VHFVDNARTRDLDVVLVIGRDDRYLEGVNNSELRQEWVEDAWQLGTR